MDLVPAVDVEAWRIMAREQMRVDLANLEALIESGGATDEQRSYASGLRFHLGLPKADWDTSTGEWMTPDDDGSLSTSSKDKLAWAREHRSQLEGHLAEVDAQVSAGTATDAIVRGAARLRALLKIAGTQDPS